MSIDKHLVKKASLEKLFAVLKQQGKTIYAPLLRNGKASYGITDNFADITNDYIQTTQSAKTAVFPRTETLFNYTKDKEGTSIKDFDPQSVPEVIVWGVRPCDAAGFAPLSAIFNWDYKDNLFNTRMQKTTIIGFSCNKADEYCFCTSVGGNPGNETGNDILFTKLGDGGDYLAEIITDKGKAIVSMVPDLFEPAQNIEKEKYLANVPVKFNREELKGKLEAFFESEVWAEQSMRCLGCGACAYVCPTCACFDIQDEVHGKNGTRVRCWDSCGFSMFTMHTSGHNPREIQSQRWRQRLMHKFSYMPDRLSVYGCTGCARCSRACPVDMNILEHLIAMQEIKK
jgi:sulfhydrogenase subunit beta (sulfur reductase)